MKPLLKLACLCFASAGMAFGQTTTTITFDDLPVGTDYGGDVPYDAPIPNGYAGFQWNNFWVDTALVMGGGDMHGMVSAPNVAFNAYGFPASFTGGPFNLNSAYLMDAWVNGLQVEVQGFVGTKLTYDNTYTVNTTGSTLINFNYVGVDEVNFISHGNPFGMDNLTVTEVPEPSLLTLASLGAAVLMLWHRRK